MPRGDLTAEILSGSSNGMGIAVAATATPGTAIHVGQSGTTDFDLVTLYAINIGDAVETLTIEFGGTGAGTRISRQLAPYRGLELVVDRLPIRNGLTIAAFATTANKINIFGRNILAEVPT